MESSGFFSLVAGTLFLAVCAYGGAALYRQVEQPEIVTVQRTHLRESAELEGIVLRVVEVRGLVAARRGQGL